MTSMEPGAGRSAKVALVANHPAYEARAELSSPALKSLAEDLVG